MKKTIRMCALLFLFLMLFSCSQAESDIESINALYAQLLNDELPMLAGDPIPYGRLLIAVYEYGNETEPRLSCEEMNEEGFYGIPKDRLASGLAQAQTLILIYPREVQANPVQTYVYTTVCVVDLIQNGRYTGDWVAHKQKIDRPVINLGPGLGTMGGSSDISMDMDKAMDRVLLLMEETAAAADESLYRLAEQHESEHLYYTARQEFLQSLWGDWNERAAACIQLWPENGRVWETDQVQVASARLSIQVNQPEDSAFFARLYKEEKAYAGLFVAGTGTATVSIPSGEYALRVGSGTVWYGGREVFGPDVPYQYMKFDEGKSDTIQIQTGFAYTLTVNVEKTEIGEGVQSKPETWENIVE